jgi:hypothetical protein
LSSSTSRIRIVYLAPVAPAPASAEITTAAKVSASPKIATAAKIPLSAKAAAPTKAFASAIAAKIATAAKIAAPTIAAAAPGSRVAIIAAIHLRCGYRRRRREIAPFTRAIEIIAARRGAQHPASARIGIQPFDAPIGPHPFEMIMFRTARTSGGAVGVIEFARMGTAHFGQDAVQWLHAGSPVFRALLGRHRSMKTDGQSRCEENKA